MKRKIELPKGLSLKDLRWRRDLAKHDGDFKLAFACALEIDKIKFGKAEGSK
jgi:hypothetical protein